MPTFINEIDAVYGRLTVTQFAYFYTSKCGKSRVAMWQCRCECGREKVVAGTDLRRGKTVSCGVCIRAELVRNRPRHRGRFVPTGTRREYVR